MNRKPSGSSLLLSKVIVIRYATAALDQGKLEPSGVNNL
jgi:hypothetical protein